MKEKSDEKLKVEIPKWYLLTLAVNGNMGDGELPTIMRIWAQKECERLGIYDEMRELQKDRPREMEKRLRGVLGDEAVGQIVTEIGKVAKALKSSR